MGRDIYEDNLKGVAKSQDNHFPASGAERRHSDRVPDCRPFPTLYASRQDKRSRDIIDKAGADMKAFEHVNYCLAVRKG